MELKFAADNLAEAADHLFITIYNNNYYHY